MENTFSRTILQWYSAFGRDLPWRRTRDPYALWLSEIILQQTRIVQGQAYWERFMKRFPDVTSLAAASEDEVLRLWEGLGYYSRGRNLLTAARQIAARGSFPETLEEIRMLKGVGEYTAAAIGSIAFNLPVAVVDGNVYRVLARHFGIRTPLGTTAARKEFTRLAHSLLPSDRPGDFNQGMMDFGALQCTPVSPRCSSCPLAPSCIALKNGSPEKFPVKRMPSAAKKRWLTYVYIRSAGKTAIRRRDARDIWQGLWEPLVLERESPETPPLFPTTVSTGSLRLLRKEIRHQLTHQTLYADFFLLESDVQPELPEDFIWIREAELDRYAKPRLFERLLQELR